MVLDALRGDSGQINIDFLFGFGVFMVVFIFIASFIPGLFVPFQPGAIDLSSVAYRTSTILVEDPGWYHFFGPHGEELGAPSWESHSFVDLARVGLADNRSTPNIVSIDKINALNGLMKTDYTLARDKMGLSSTSLVYGQNIPVVYDVNITLNMSNDLAQTPPETLIAPSCPNATTQTVETIRRNVMVDMGRALFADSGARPDLPHDSMLRVNITNIISRDSNLTIRIYNASGATGLQDVRRGKSGLYESMTIDEGYFVYLNGKLIHALPPIVGSGDVVDIVIVKDKIADITIDSIAVQADGNLFLGREIDFEHDPIYKRKSMLYPGELRLDVWMWSY